MNSLSDTAKAAVSVGGGQRAGEPGKPDKTGPNETGLSLVTWIAQYHGKQFSENALLARMPEGADFKSPEMISRALAVAGLKTQVVLRDPLAIDDIALPLILFRKTGQPVVMTNLSADRKIANIVDPAAANLEQEVRVRELRRSIRPEVMLVTPAEEKVLSRLSPDARNVVATERHWFWGPVRANWANWALVLVAALCLNILSLALPLFVMNVYDKVIPNLAFVTLWTLAIGVAIALFLELVLRTIRANVLENIGRRVDLRSSADLFRQAMNVRLMSRPGGAAGIAGTIRDFEMVREFFASATFVSIIDLLFIGIFVTVLYWIVGPISLVPMVAVPLVLALAFVAQIPIGRTAAKAQQMATKRHIVLVESLSGIETIKSLNAEPVMQREWENAVAASSRINGRTKFWSNVATNGTMLVQQSVSVIIIIWGVFLVSEGLITIGGLIAANILAGRVLAPLGTIAQTIFRAQYAFKSLSALNRFMALPVEQSNNVSGNLRVETGRVQFQSVTMTYPEARVPALRDLSFSIAAGECVALLGKVGSGKTTTGKVMTGLLTPESGTVLVDGVALSQYDIADLRAGLGYLPQNPEIFTGTLRENLAIGDNDASDAEIQQALYFAAMDDFTASVPEGFDLFVGEQGGRLSGGQRQGVSLARLLLRQPRLLFLDEPTNAMDQRMEAKVIARLQELNQQGTGLILCTHRQSLAAIADRLIVMDQGRVVLDGPRVEVLNQLHARSAAGSEG